MALLGLLFATKVARRHKVQEERNSQAVAKLQHLHADFRGKVKVFVNLQGDFHVDDVVSPLHAFVHAQDFALAAKPLLVETFSELDAFLPVKACSKRSMKDFLLTATFFTY